MQKYSINFPEKRLFKKWSDDKVVDLKVKTLGSEVRERRRKKELTQQQLALKISVTPSYISKIESDVLDLQKEGPGEAVVYGLAKELAIDDESIEDLFEYFMIVYIGKIPETRQKEVIGEIRKKLEESTSYDFARTKQRQAVSQFDLISTIVEQIENKTQ